MENRFFDFDFSKRKPGNKCDVFKLIFHYFDKYDERLKKEYANKRPIPISKTQDFVYKLIYDRIAPYLETVHDKSQEFNVAFKKGSKDLELCAEKLLNPNTGIYGGGIANVFQAMQRTDLLFRGIVDISKKESAFSKRIDEIVKDMKSNSLKNGYKKVFLCASEENLKDVRDFLRKFMDDFNKSKFSEIYARIFRLCTLASGMPLMGLTDRAKKFVASKFSGIRKPKLAEAEKNDKKSKGLEKDLAEELRSKLNRK